MRKSVKRIISLFLLVGMITQIFGFQTSYAQGYNESERGNSNRIYISDYLTNEEVITSFLPQAQVGPAAIIAALTGLGAAIGGPVGATIVTIVAYISGVDLMYLVLRAAVQQKVFL